MKFLVTGHRGFIAQYLVNFLLNKGHSVVGIDKLSFVSSKNLWLSHSEWSSRIKEVFADINDRPTMESIVLHENVDGVFHLAAETHVDRSLQNPDTFLFSNVNGTYTLMDVFRGYSKPGFKIIHVSTDEVYGQLSEEDSPWTEESMFSPRNPYAATKAASDLIAFSMHLSYQIPVIITHCCNNFGLRQFPEKYIPKMLKCIESGTPIPMHGTGLQSREWIDVEDHVEALWTVFTKGKIGETYNISSEFECTNLKLCQFFLSCAEEKTGENVFKNVGWKYVPDRIPNDWRYAMSSSKLKSLGWSVKKNPLDKMRELFFEKK